MVLPKRFSNYLRHWEEDPDMAEPGNRVLRELLNAKGDAISALMDSDPRARGYAASLLMQLSAPSEAASVRGSVITALETETDPVAIATMRLASMSSTGVR